MAEHSPIRLLCLEEPDEALTRGPEREAPHGTMVRCNALGKVGAGERRTSELQTMGAMRCLCRCWIAAKEMPCCTSTLLESETQPPRRAIAHGDASPSERASPRVCGNPRSCRTRQSWSDETRWTSARCTGAGAAPNAISR